MNSTDGLLPVIHRLYSAAAGTREWDPFLDELRRLFRARGAQIVRVAPSNTQLTFSALLGFDDFIWNLYDGHSDSFEDASARYRHHFAQLMHEDPRIRLILRSPNQSISCRLALDAKQLHASRAYKEILDFADVEYSLVVNLPEEDGASIMMGVFRGKDGTHFTQEDATLFQSLIPFVKQAVAINEEFSRLHLERHLLHTVLDAMTVAIFIVSSTKRIVYSNALARALQEDRKGPMLAGSALRLKNRPEEERLRLAVEVACSVERQQQPDHQSALTITRPKGLAPLSAIVVSRSAEHKPIFGLSSIAQSLAVIFLTLPEAPPETPAESIRRLFDLTPAQAKLCEVLVSGLSLDEASERLLISPQTARTQLKRIFGAMGVRRQSELIAKILRSPLGFVKAPSRANGRHIARARKNGSRTRIGT